MLRLRKMTTVVLPAFIVYALIVPGSWATACTCCHADNAYGIREIGHCPNPLAQADFSIACHHNPKLQTTNLANGYCHCSVLPAAMATSYVPAFGALTPLSWMQGAAHILCLLDSAADSSVAQAGIRPPPLGSSLNPSISPLKSVVLII